MAQNCLWRVPSRPVGRWRGLRTPRIGLLLLLLVLLSGCGDLLAERRQRAALPLDFAAGLPSGWEPIEAWHEVSIDGDAASEYLLLFRFDVGQIGAVIYDGQVNGGLLDGVGQDEPRQEDAAPANQNNPDNQNNGEGLAGTPLPPDADADGGQAAQGSGALAQGFGYYRPYRLLPSYWAFSYGGDPGHGMIALPDDADAIQVFRVPLAGGEQTPEAPAELVLLGGTTHLTFVWWKNLLEGYGVTQLVANGGFIGLDWEEWGKNPTPILSISGLEPLMDYRARSLICRQIDYSRPSAAGAQADNPAQEDGVAFTATDRGLRFCSDLVPAYPFYPEGVVLAYLQRPVVGERTLEQLVAPGVTPAQIDADGALERLSRERIDDIDTYRTIPVAPSGIQAGDFAPTTSVCVQLGDRIEPTIQRWLVFTLRYQPPDSATQLPDRWTIAGVRFEPQPVTTPQRPYCQTVLARSAP